MKINAIINEKIVFSQRGSNMMFLLPLLSNIYIIIFNI